jgi:hypothetical protein
MQRCSTVQEEQLSEADARAQEAAMVQIYNRAALVLSEHV